MKNKCSNNSSERPQKTQVWGTWIPNFSSLYTIDNLPLSSKPKIELKPWVQIRLQNHTLPGNSLILRWDHAIVIQLLMLKPPLCWSWDRSRFHCLVLDTEVMDPSDLEAVRHCYSPQLLCHNSLVPNTCLFVDQVRRHFMRVVD